MFRFDAEFRREFQSNWLILGIAFSCLLFGLSAPAFAMPFIFPEVIEEFGWTREEATLLATVKWVAGAVAAVLVGRFVDRIGVWVALVVTTLFGAAALLSFLWVDNLPTYYATGLLLGFAGPGAMVAVKVLVSRTFDASQGTAMGITLQGTNVGAVIIPLLITALITAFGWRQGMALLSVGILLIAIPLILLGYFADTKGVGRRIAAMSSASPPPSGEGRRGEGEVGRTLLQLMRTRDFVLVALAVFIGGIVDGAFIQHQVLIFQDLDLSKEAIALGVSAIGVIGIVGRVLVGNILDGTSNKGLAVLYMTLAASAVLAFFLENPVVLVVFVGLRAIGHATALLDTTVMAKHVFGASAHLGVILGIFSASTGLGFALGPWVLGVIYDANGAYAAGFALLAVLPALAALMVWVVKPVFWLNLRKRQAPLPGR